MAADAALHDGDLGADFRAAAVWTGATIAMVFYLNALNAMALGTASLAMLLMLAGIAVVAFWRSLGDLELLGEGTKAVGPYPTNGR